MNFSFVSDISAFASFLEGVLSFFSPCVLPLLPVYFSFLSGGNAERELGWKAKYNLVDMCRDSWNWQKNNPNGFEE